MHVISLVPLTSEVHAGAVQQVYRATPNYWAMYNLAGSPAGQAQRDLEAAFETPDRHMLGIVRHVQPQARVNEMPENTDATTLSESRSPESHNTESHNTEAPEDPAPTEEVDLELVGIVDFRLYWPAPDVAYIGMIMVAEPFQREGIGRQAWALLRPWLVETAQVKKARLGIEQFNIKALHFFQALGFTFTGETNRIEVGSKWVRLLYMEFVLDEQ